MAYVMPAITGVARIREQEKVETVRLPTVLDTVRVVLSDSGSLLLDAGVCKEVFRGNELDAIAEFERLLDLAAENGLWYHSERLCEGFSASHERSHYDPFLYALYAAARKGSVRGLDILVDMVGWIDAKDSEGRTALFWAASEGHPEVVTLLHLRGADINTTNRCGSTPLLWAASEGNLAVVKSLLDRGADVNLANSDKSTPLLWAASEGHEKIVMLLLIEGAEVNAANLDEWTPLLWAARGGYTGIVDLLLKNQALVNCRNSDGSTPLMWAASQGHEDVVRLLLAHGADISLRDNLGWDALSLAARKGYKAVEAQLKNRPKGALISPAKGMDLQPKKIRTGEHSVKGGKREHLQVATVPARIHLPR
jgi:ankyrin repeat protein